MNMPSVPKADIIAVAQAAIAAAVAFGAPLNQHQQDTLLALATIVATVLITADVKRRANRLAAGAHEETAKPVPPAFVPGAHTPISPAPPTTLKKPAAKKPPPKKP